MALQSEVNVGNNREYLRMPLPFIMPLTWTHDYTGLRGMTVRVRIDFDRCRLESNAAGLSAIEIRFVARLMHGASRFPPRRFNSNLKP